jgi:hypothetical protein
MGAKVTLRKARSWKARGKLFKRGVPQVITKEEDINYFKGNEAFSVVELKKSSASPKRKAKAAPPDEPPAPDTEESPPDDEEEEATPKAKTKTKKSKRK